MRALVLVMVAGTGLLGLSGCVDATSYRAAGYRAPGPTTTTTTTVVRDANGMPLSTAEAVRDGNGNPVNPPGSYQYVPGTYQNGPGYVPQAYPRY
jgi:hypothetical protein